MKHDQQRRFLIFWTDRCVCGLRWPCPDDLGWQSGEPVPDAPARLPVGQHPGWNGGTVATPEMHVGRTGTLTPAQRYRSNGGRW